MKEMAILESTLSEVIYKQQSHGHVVYYDYF